jgi:ribulose-5-phosphate 4-epimerase/fuculose-1-phosphate aldolase
MPSTEATLIEKCMKAWRFLYRRGFIEGFGHISVRIPGTDTYMLTRHSLGRVIVPDDMLVYDASGKQIGGKGDRPGEAPIHHEVYRARPDVNSVMHYHGMYATAFSTSGAHTLKPIHLMGTLFADGIPVYDDPRLVSTTERGVALATALGSHRAALLRAHGSVITGGDIEECVTGAFFLEENARRAHLSCTLGQPQWIEDGMAKAAAEELIRTRGPMRRVWAMVEVEGLE